MSKPLSRRLFMRTAAVAPVMAREAATAALAQQEATAIAATGLSQAFAQSPMPFGMHIMANPKLLALWKAGLLPDWARQDLDYGIGERARYLDTDVQALRSVSLSAKKAINHRRIEQRAYAEMERSALIDMARRAFWGDGGN